MSDITTVMVAQASSESALALPRTSARPGGRAASAKAPVAAESHLSLPDKSLEVAAYWAFAAYAAAVVILARGQDEVWAACAAPAYGAAAVMTRRYRPGRIALLTAALAVAVPLSLLVADSVPAGMTVIERSATLMLRNGSPYLPVGHLSSWLAYDPYLPAMTLFGLPRAFGLAGAAGDPRPWLVLVTVAALAGAIGTLVSHPVRLCRSCRRGLLTYTAFAAACPVMALNLAVTTTDPPVVALMILSLALAARTERTALSAAALGLACAMKPTAWLAVPVIAWMLLSRDGARSAVRFIATAASFPVAAMIPALLTSPAATVQNTVLFPLGLTRHLTPAQSLTPGDLLGGTGPVGHDISIGLLLAAGLFVAASLAVRPPRDPRAATWRLALGLTLMFALGPAERFGYFIYPLGLVGWLCLTRHAGAEEEGRRTPNRKVGVFPWPRHSALRDDA